MDVGYKKSLLIIVILLVICSMTGISYAYYNKGEATKKNASLVLSDENLSVNYSNGKNFNILDFAPEETVTKQVSVTNVNRADTFITISLMDVLKTDDSNLKLIVYDQNEKEVYNSPITNIDTDIIKTVPLSSGKTLSYTIMIKNNGMSDVKNFFANILVYKENTQADILTFNNIILKSNQVSSQGSDLLSTNEGLIKSTDDDGEAYFFRGNVNNNYVNFGGFTWRILRINGNGTVRLITQDILDDLEPFNSNTDVVDNYLTKLDYNSSAIKVKVEEWINTNLIANLKYLVDTVYCNDTTINKEENNIVYLNPYTRNFVDSNPSLTCSGNKITSKVGIINADEVTLAGAYEENQNQNFFLYNGNNNGFWTMSGSQILASNNTADVISVNPNGSLNYQKKISTSLGIRPVISLDKNTIVTGTGTQTDPYVIKTK